MAKPVVDSDWDIRSTAASIQACKEVVCPGSINPRAAIGTLSDTEWYWIASAAIFASINVRALQAVAEGTDYDSAIRRQHDQNPPPWDAGAIESILPILAEMTLPWSSPIGSWPKSQMVKLCWRIFQLAEEAMKSREKGQVDTITRKLSLVETQREASAAVGGGLLAPGEMASAGPEWDSYTASPHTHDGKLNDTIPF
jgi:hypothetical protein